MIDNSDNNINTIPILPIDNIRNIRNIRTMTSDYNDRDRGENVWIRDQIVYYQKVNTIVIENIVNAEHYRIWLKHNNQYPSLDLYMTSDQKFFMKKGEWYLINLHPKLWYINNIEITKKPHKCGCTIL